MSRVGIDSSKTVARRTLLAHGGATLAGFAMLDSAFAEAFAAPAAAEVTPGSTSRRRSPKPGLAL
jgi:hypothetical protein